MPQVYVDTSVLAYAIGGPHPEREACRAVVAAVPSGGIELHASVEVIQQLLFHRMRRVDVVTAAGQARAAAAACVLHHGLVTVVSTDAAFDFVPGLTRVTPADFALQLVG